VRYHYGLDATQVLTRSDGSGLSWLLSDRLGSVRDVVRAGTQVLDHIQYSSFGEVLSETDSSVGGSILYTGLRYDRDTGLLHTYHREYAAATGRWLQQDPIGFGAGDVNLYRYVGNNATNGSDPSGLSWWSSAWSGAVSFGEGIFPSVVGSYAAVPGIGLPALIYTQYQGISAVNSVWSNGYSTPFGNVGPGGLAVGASFLDMPAQVMLGTLTGGLFSQGYFFYLAQTQGYDAAWANTGAQTGFILTSLAGGFGVGGVGGGVGKPTGGGVGPGFPANSQLVADCTAKGVPIPKPIMAGPNSLPWGAWGSWLSSMLLMSSGGGGTPPQPPGSVYGSYEDGAGVADGEVDALEYIGPTDQEAWFQAGFTEAWTGYLTPFEEWWTAFKNPTTGQWGGFNYSSRNDW
jgi:RHS repeat-associated protein